jgi:protein-S-isoprenylcysteine O-methyltransferase Ste14
MLRSLFVDHPESVGESYAEHFGVALGFGVTMVTAGLACLVHALVPGLFVKTGSRAVTELYYRMVRHRQRVRDNGITSVDALEWVI